MKTNLSSFDGYGNDEPEGAFHSFGDGPRGAERKPNAKVFGACHLCAAAIGYTHPPPPFLPVRTFTGCTLVHDEGRTGPLLSVACDTCGLVQTFPHPTPAEVSSWYSSGQYRRDFPWLPLFELDVDGKATGRMVKPDSPDYEAQQARHGEHTARRLVDTYNLQKTDRILEVGCGAGWVSVALLKMGFFPNAVEADHEMLATAGRNGALVMSPAMVPIGHFDFVFAHQVAEHFADPVGQLFDDVARYAKPGGIVSVEVPTVERPYVSLSHFFQYPHVVNYSTHTLKTALEMAGLNDVITVIEGSVLVGAGIATGERRPYKPHGGPSGAEVAAELQAWEARRLADPAEAVKRFLAGGSDESDLIVARGEFQRWMRTAGEAIRSIHAPHGLCGLYDSVQWKDWDPNPWVRGFLAGRIYEGQRASRACDHVANQLIYNLNKADA